MEEANGSPSLVLVEHHEALRDGLAVLLERRGFSVVGCATTAAQGEEVIAEQEPDLAVVGVELPDERGTELVKRMHERGAGSKFVIYTGLTDPDLLGAAKTLSGREAEILGMLARGLTGEEIAQRLVLSPETVRTHVRNAMGKLDARTRTEAVVKALEREEIHNP
jgi:DNA-binding NarL/FixJ family response regulator